MKKDFIAKESLLNGQKTHQLIGFKINDKFIARPDYKVFDHHGQFIGYVTSATFIPSKNLSIGFAYVSYNTALGNDIFIDIRNKNIKATVCKRNFLFQQLCC